MQSIVSRFRRRTFAPSVDAFDGWMRALDARLTRLEDKIDHLVAPGPMPDEPSERNDKAQPHDGRTEQDEVGVNHLQAGVAQLPPGLSPLEMIDPKPSQTEVRSLLRLIEPRRVDRFSKVRVGSIFDGGYVMLDDLNNIDRAFSLGVSANDEWDAQMARRGVDVFQYDYTVEHAPTSHERLHFSPLKVAVTGEANSISVEAMAAGFTDKSKCILKSDIEGSEWDVIDGTPSAIIDRFSQIILEFHWMQRLSEPDFFQVASRVFSKLHATHQSIHIHANNCAPIFNIANVAVPVVLEVTYVRRRDYDFVATDEVFPTPLDAPNDHRFPDIFLGTMRF